METYTYEGVTYTRDANHGGWFEFADRRIGSWFALEREDGSFDEDNVGVVEFTFYEISGVCNARCEDCVAEEARWLALESQYAE